MKAIIKEKHKQGVCSFFAPYWKKGIHIISAAMAKNGFSLPTISYLFHTETNGYLVINHRFAYKLLKELGV